MIYIKRDPTPQSLIEGNNMYQEAIKSKSLTENKDIINYYKSKEKEVTYSRNDVKKAFEEMNLMRCTFCGRIMVYGSDTSKERRTYTIEHIKPKHEFPLLIYDWENLLCSCERCNNTRRSKPYKEDLYLDPTKIIDIEQYFEYDYEGNIYPNDNIDSKLKDSVKYMVDTYGLNLNSNKKLFLLSQRKRFYEQIRKPEFKKMLELEGIKEFEYIRCDSIKFYHLFLYNERRKK